MGCSTRAPTPAPQSWLDPETNTFRRVTLTDLKYWGLLTDRLEHIDFYASIVPDDVPPATADVHTIRTALDHVEKMIWVQPYTFETVEYLVELGIAAAGGEENARKYPHLNFITCSLSPFHDEGYGCGDNPPMCPPRNSHAAMQPACQWHNRPHDDARNCHFIGCGDTGNAGSGPDSPGRHPNYQYIFAIFSRYAYRPQPSMHPPGNAASSAIHPAYATRFWHSGAHLWIRSGFSRHR